MMALASKSGKNVVGDTGSRASITGISRGESLASDALEEVDVAPSKLNAEIVWNLNRGIRVRVPQGGYMGADQVLVQRLRL